MTAPAGIRTMQSSDHGTTCRALHGPSVIETVERAPGGQALTTRRRMLAPIDALGGVAPEWRTAACHLRDDVEIGLQLRRAPDPAVPRRAPGEGRGGADGPAVARLAALDRVRVARRTVGAHAWAVLYPFICEEVDATALARRLGRNRQEIVGTIKSALALLAERGRHRG